SSWVARRLLGVSALAAWFSRAFVHLAAGTLRYDGFREMARQGWASLDASDRNELGGFFEFERKLYAQYVHAGDRVLVVGCGSGRDVLPFLAAGHEVVGVDPSPVAVAVLRRLLNERGL